MFHTERKSQSVEKRHLDTRF